MLEDIAVLTGGQVISEEKGMKLEEFSDYMLGSARKVTVDNNKTIIVEGRGDKAKIEDRVRDHRSPGQYCRSRLSKDRT